MLPQTWKVVTFGVALSLGAFAGGCISSDAGYGDLRALVNQRGLELDTQRRSGKLDQQTRRLLEAPLTPDAAARIALLNNAEVDAAVARVGIARAELVGMASLPNPHGELAVKFGHDEPSLELGVMEDLTGLLLYGTRRSAGNEQLQAEVHAVADDLLQIANRARRAAIEFQVESAKLRLQKRALGAAYAAFEAAQRLREAGNITALALARHQAVYEQVRLATANTANRFSVRRNVLLTALGLLPEQAALKSGALSRALPQQLGSGASLVKSALDASLRLRSLDHRYAADADAANYALAKGWLPELKAGVVAEREEGQWVVGPGIELELPLFYQGQGEVGAAKARMRQIRAQYTAAAVNIRNAASSAFENATAAKARVDYYAETLLPLQATLVEQALLQYNAMSIGLFELMAAKQSQLAAQQEQLDALGDFWLAHAELQLVLAGGTPSMAQPASGSDGASAAAAPADAH